MIHLLPAEWLKLRKRWMPRILVLIMLTIIGLIFWGIGASGNQRDNLFIPRGWLVALVISAIYIAPFLWPILAGSWAGGEYGWGTVRLVLSRRPDRAQFVGAGLIMVLIAVGLALLAGVVLGTGLGALVAAITGNSAIDTGGLSGHFIAVLIECFFATWYVLAFYVVLAYASGTLFRSSGVGIGVGLGLTLAELILTGIFLGLGGTWETIARHFPSVYTVALPGRIAEPEFRHGFNVVGSNSPGIGESIIGIGIYIAVPLILTFILVRVRDVSA